jgi:hypothetical protein
MILGLPIDDFPMCGLVSLVGWRDFVGEAIDIRPPPPDVAADQKEKKSSGVHFGWLIAHFVTCRRALRTQSFRGMLDLVFGI